MKPTITTHTVVKNEDRFIWFAIMSVLDQVDQMLICDTGSTDQTVSIIQSIHSPKIIFSQEKISHPHQITQIRQRQLDQTRTDWFMVLDGDEVYWNQTLLAIKQAIRTKPQAYGIITPTINCVGDIFHYQEDQAGKYTFGPYRGHYAVRATRRSIPGLHLKNTYPLEGYYDSNNQLITDYSDKLVYVDQPYLHLTNLSRSTSTDTQTFSRQKKYEIGRAFSASFRYPEVFYQPRPSLVPDPWVKPTFWEKLKSYLQTPLKKIKRRLFP